MKLTDLNILDVGNKIGLVGAVFGDDDTHYLGLFPDQEVLPQKNLEMGTEDWTRFLRQVDLQEVEVLSKTKDGALAKSILRKTQRLIEQRVSWNVYRRDNYRCRYCGRDDVPLTVDHLVLWEQGGPSTEDNLVAACRKCNKTRGNMLYEDWLASPYYQRVSDNLTALVRQDNVDIAKTLSNIQLKIHRRERK